MWQAVVAYTRMNSIMYFFTIFLVRINSLLSSFHSFFIQTCTMDCQKRAARSNRTIPYESYPLRPYVCCTMWYTIQGGMSNTQHTSQSPKLTKRAPHTRLLLYPRLGADHNMLFVPL